MHVSVTIHVEITDPDTLDARKFCFQVEASEDNAALIRMMNAAGASAVEFAMGEKEEEDKMGMSAPATCAPKEPRGQTF